MKDLLTVRDVAKELNRTVRNVYSIIDDGHLPFVRIGSGKGRIYVRKSDLEEYMKHGNKRVRGDSK